LCYCKILYPCYVNSKKKLVVFHASQVRICENVEHCVTVRSYIPVMLKEKISDNIDIFQEKVEGLKVEIPPFIPCEIKKKPGIVIFKDMKSEIRQRAIDMNVSAVFSLGSQILKEERQYIEKLMSLDVLSKEGDIYYATSGPNLKIDKKVGFSPGGVPMFFRYIENRQRSIRAYYDILDTFGLFYDDVRKLFNYVYSIEESMFLVSRVRIRRRQKYVRLRLVDIRAMFSFCTGSAYVIPIIKNLRFMRMEMSSEYILRNDMLCGGPMEYYTERLFTKNDNLEDKETIYEFDDDDIDVYVHLKFDPVQCSSGIKIEGAKLEELREGVRSSPMVFWGRYKPKCANFFLVADFRIKFKK